MTKHHLIPRARHRNKRVRRRFARQEREGRVLWVCRPCHDQIHAVVSEKDLAAHYNSRERLLSHPEVQRFATWLAAKPPGFTPKSRSWRHRR